MRESRLPGIWQGAVKRNDRAALGPMLLFAKFLDAMTESLTETDRHAWIAIDDGIEILTGDLQEH